MPIRPQGSSWRAGALDGSRDAYGTSTLPSVSLRKESLGSGSVLSPSAQASPRSQV